MTGSSTGASADTPAQRLKLRFTDFSSGVPEGFLGELHAGLEGGQPTWDFFAGALGPMHELARHIAHGGAGVWHETTDPETGLPVLSTHAGGASATLRGYLDSKVLGESSSDYRQAGIATAVITTDQGESDVIVATIEKLGEAIDGAIGTALLVKLLKPLLTSFRNFVKGFVERTVDADPVDDPSEAEQVAEEAAEEAAEDAAEDGVEVAEELAIDIAFSALDVVGIVVALGILAVVIILLIIAKKFTFIVKVYNATSRALDLSLCHLYNGEAAIQPKTGRLPPVGKPPAPPDVKPVGGQKVIFRADYVLVNHSILEGLGFLIRAEPTGGFPGLDAAGAKPLIGKNTQYVALELRGSCSEAFDGYAWKDHRLAVGISSGPFTARMATNQSVGESRSPITDKKGFFFEYLVVVEEKGVVGKEH